MAISKIQYDDKVAINIDSTIPDINKCNASDLNEIKSVVNNNADEIPSNDNLVNVGTSVDNDYKTNVLTTKNLLNEELAKNVSNYTESIGSSYYGMPIQLIPNTIYTISTFVDSPVSADNSFILAVRRYETPSQNLFIINSESSKPTITNESYTFETGESGILYLVERYGTTEKITSILNQVKLQIEQGNQATTYEAFIPNTINVNNEKYTDTINVGTEINNKNRVNVLYSHNLFDKNNINVLNAYIGTANGTIASLNNGRTIWIPIKANTTYTISKLKSAKFVIATYTTQPAINVSGTNVVYNNDATSLTITSGANDKYLAVWLFNGDVDTLTYQQIIDSLMINEGSEALPYEPYIVPSINIDNEEIYSKGKILFSGSTSASTTGVNITLNDDILNYKYLDIDLGVSTTQHCVYRLYLDVSNTIQTLYLATTTYNFQFTCQFSDSTCTFIQNNVSGWTGIQAKLFKVIGYK